MAYTVSKGSRSLTEILFNEHKIEVQNNTGYTVWLECCNGIRPEIQKQQWGVLSGDATDVNAQTQFVTLNFTTRHEDVVYVVGKNIPMGRGYKLTLNKVTDLSKLPILTEFSI